LKVKNGLTLSASDSSVISLSTNGLDQGVDFVEVEHFKFVLRSQLKQNWLKSSYQKFLMEAEVKILEMIIN
jgi:hypothetical protein